PRSMSTSYSYDSLGRFASVTDATGAVRSFSRSELANGFKVTRTTPEGHITTLETTRQLDGTIKHTNTFPSGLANISQQNVDRAKTLLTLTDGDTVTTDLATDPRFGMLAPLSVTTTQTPLGLSRKVEEQRIVTLSSPGDLLHPATI